MSHDQPVMSYVIFSIYIKCVSIVSIFLIFWPIWIRFGTEVYFKQFIPEFKKYFHKIVTWPASDIICHFSSPVLFFINRLYVLYFLINLAEIWYRGAFQAAYSKNQNIFCLNCHMTSQWRHKSIFSIYIFKRWPWKIAYPLKMVQYSKYIFTLSDVKYCNH